MLSPNHYFAHYDNGYVPHNFPKTVAQRKALVHRVESWLDNQPDETDAAHNINKKLKYDGSPAAAFKSTPMDLAIPKFARHLQPTMHGMLKDHSHNLMPIRAEQENIDPNHAIISPNSWKIRVGQWLQNTSTLKSTTPKPNKNFGKSRLNTFLSHLSPRRTKEKKRDRDLANTNTSANVEATGIFNEKMRLKVRGILPMSVPPSHSSPQSRLLQVKLNHARPSEISECPQLTENASTSFAGSFASLVEHHSPDSSSYSDKLTSRLERHQRHNFTSTILDNTMDSHTNQGDADDISLPNILRGELTSESLGSDISRHSLSSLYAPTKGNAMIPKTLAELDSAQSYFMMRSGPLGALDNDGASIYGGIDFGIPRLENTITEIETTQTKIIDQMSIDESGVDEQSLIDEDGEAFFEKLEEMYGDRIDGNLRMAAWFSFDKDSR